jgi:hypothetical protein
MHGAWSPSTTPEFRPVFQPSAKHEADQGFAYKNRVLTSHDRARTRHELALQKMSTLTTPIKLPVPVVAEDD